jgi:hypothetical protein
MISTLKKTEIIHRLNFKKKIKIFFSSEFRIKMKIKNKRQTICLMNLNSTILQHKITK